MGNNTISGVPELSFLNIYAVNRCYQNQVSYECSNGVAMRKQYRTTGTMSTTGCSSLASLTSSDEVVTQRCVYGQFPGEAVKRFSGNGYSDENETPSLLHDFSPNTCHNHRCYDSLHMSSVKILISIGIARVWGYLLAVCVSRIYEYQQLALLPHNHNANVRSIGKSEFYPSVYSIHKTTRAVALVAGPGSSVSSLTAGSTADGTLLNARFWDAADIQYYKDPLNNEESLFVAGKTIRRIAITGSDVSTVITYDASSNIDGSFGPGGPARVSWATSIAADQANQKLYFTQSGSNAAVRSVNLALQEIQKVTGSPVISGLGHVVYSTDTLFFYNGSDVNNHGIYSLPAAGGSLSQLCCHTPSALKVPKESYYKIVRKK
eukprot:jgi/Bigna1/70635/fgenesh1_pg.12_\